MTSPIEPNGGRLDTSNRFEVAVRGSLVVVLNFGDRVHWSAPGAPILTRAEALNLALWLEAIADPSGEVLKEPRRGVRKVIGDQ
jgi:hypothetical protein